MSHDPFQDLFENEIPRSASAAATRSTLDTLAPQFHRAKSRRRARVSAVAAFAVLGTTGGAAALGVGPVSLNNGPRVDPNPVASSSVVENTSEPTTTAVPTTTTTAVTTTVTVTSTVPTTIPAIEVVTPIPGDDSVSGNGSEGSDGDIGSSSDSETSDSDNRGESSGDDSHSSDGSEGDNKTSPDQNDDSPHTSVPDDSATAPAPGPLTESISEGSATIDIGPNGLFITDITPATGMTYEVKSKPDKIDIQFHDLVSGSELSTLEFRLVDGGITVKVDLPH